MLSLKQLIQVSTRVTCTSSTIINHILQAFPTAFHSKVPLMLGILITKLYTALEKSPESKEVEASALDAVQ